MNCRKCGAEALDSSIYCRLCGRKMKQPKLLLLGALMMIIGFIFLLMIAAVHR